MSKLNINGYVEKIMKATVVYEWSQLLGASTPHSIKKWEPLGNVGLSDPERGPKEEEEPEIKTGTGETWLYRFTLWILGGSDDMEKYTKVNFAAEGPGTINGQQQIILTASIIGAEIVKPRRITGASEKLGPKLVCYRVSALVPNYPILNPVDPKFSVLEPESFIVWVTAKNDSGVQLIQFK
ncbi:MAG TPA: hypothetical protein PLX89_21705 [Verrucomicrobiota bacterium]|nr:hypothetical protein [Verrucomicrobiales bacterium]HRI15620.1 hypothetical protein [Verrucomicrobiota bacterium]